MAKKKTVGKLKKDLQKVFNAYIRLRDADKPCISCSEYKTLQAGHYFAVGGYDGLRFDEDNTHGECSYCNCFNESHLIKYGVNLKDKIGGKDYHALCARADHYKAFGNKFTRYDLEEKIEYYKKILKFKADLD